MRNCIMALALLAASAGWADDIDVKHEKLLYPVVRVRTATAGGSGTIIYSEDRAEKGTFRSYILTNHHVVDDAIKINRRWDNLLKRYVTEESNDLVDVEIFSWHGGTIIDRRTVKAFVLAHGQEDDIAILELRGNEKPYPVKMDNVAKLASVDVASKLRVFQHIYVVGCSLGHDPIHSTGEITDLSDLIEGKTYMMGSANVIFGNSGGAVFNQVDGEFYLIGIPARVAVANGAITHMNWFVPNSRIREFIARHKLDFLLDPKKTPEDAYREREKLKSASEGPGAEQDREDQGGEHEHGF